MCMGGVCVGVFTLGGCHVHVMFIIHITFLGNMYNIFQYPIMDIDCDIMSIDSQVSSSTNHVKIQDSRFKILFHKNDTEKYIK